MANAKRDRVYQVFEEVASGYDPANDRISLGFQKQWKRMLTDRVLSDLPGSEDGIRVLDVCCGTGDIAIALAGAGKNLSVTGIDFSPSMLAVAKEKAKQLDNVTWENADAADLPFAENTFRAATISFGLRNTTDYKKVLTEMMRVVKPGGWVYVLESCVVSNPVIRPFYGLYFKYLMPLIGGGRKHLQEYRWLWQSTQEFLRQDELTALFYEAGLSPVKSRSRMFGACVLVGGQKPDRVPESQDS